MDDTIRAFITFLELERHASHETVRNYASDLRQFQAFMKAEHPGVSTLNPDAVRSSSARCPVSRRLRSLSLVGVARGGKSPKFVFIG